MSTTGRETRSLRPRPALQNDDGMAAAAATIVDGAATARAIVWVSTGTITVSNYHRFIRDIEDEILTQYWSDPLQHLSDSVLSKHNYDLILEAVRRCKRCKQSDMRYAEVKSVLEEGELQDLDIDVTAKEVDVGTWHVQRQEDSDEYVLLKSFRPILHFAQFFQLLLNTWLKDWPKNRVEWLPKYNQNSNVQVKVKDLLNFNGRMRDVERRYGIKLVVPDEDDDDDDGDGDGDENGTDAVVAASVLGVPPVRNELGPPEEEEEEKEQEEESNEVDGVGVDVRVDHDGVDGKNEEPDENNFANTFDEDEEEEEEEAVPPLRNEIEELEESDVVVPDVSTREEFAAAVDVSTRDEFAAVPDVSTREEFAAAVPEVPPLARNNDQPQPLRDEKLLLKLLEQGSDNESILSLPSLPSPQNNNQDNCDRRSLSSQQEPMPTEERRLVHDDEYDGDDSDNRSQSSSSSSSSPSSSGDNDAGSETALEEDVQDAQPTTSNRSPGNGINHVISDFIDDDDDGSWHPDMSRQEDIPHLDENFEDLQASEVGYIQAENNLHFAHSPPPPRQQSLQKDGPHHDDGSHIARRPDGHQGVFPPTIQQRGTDGDSQVNDGSESDSKIIGTFGNDWTGSDASRNEGPEEKIQSETNSEGQQDTKFAAAGETLREIDDSTGETAQQKAIDDFGSFSEKLDDEARKQYGRMAERKVPEEHVLGQDQNEADPTAEAAATTALIPLGDAPPVVHSHQEEKKNDDRDNGSDDNDGSRSIASLPSLVNDDDDDDDDARDLVLQLPQPQLGEQQPQPSVREPIGTSSAQMDTSSQQREVIVGGLVGVADELGQVHKDRSPINPMLKGATMAEQKADKDLLAEAEAGLSAPDTSTVVTFIPAGGMGGGTPRAPPDIKNETKQDDDSSCSNNNNAADDSSCSNNNNAAVPVPWYIRPRQLFLWCIGKGQFFLWCIGQCFLFFLRCTQQLFLWSIESTFVRLGQLFRWCKGKGFLWWIGFSVVCYIIAMCAMIIFAVWQKVQSPFELVRVCAKYGGWTYDHCTEYKKVWKVRNIWNNIVSDCFVPWLAGRVDEQYSAWDWMYGCVDSQFGDPFSESANEKGLDLGPDL